MDRINRLNYTFLNVSKLTLKPPSDLLYDVYDKLLNGSVLGQVQISSEVLSVARKRYLYENFSLGEFRKTLVFALANYTNNCNNDTIYMLNVCFYNFIYNFFFIE